MDYTLIALDVDGTLLNDDHQLTEENLNAVREAHARGAKIVLCTGRGPINARPVLDELGFDGIMITHNGAVTIDSAKGVLLETGFSRSLVSGLVEAARRENIHFDVCTAMDMEVEQVSEAAAVMYSKFDLLPRKVQDVLKEPGEAVKLTVFGSMKEMDCAEKEWTSLVPAGLTAIRSGDFFIDYMASGVSKGAALAKLSEKLGINREHVLAIGNYYNDTDMIQWAGLGIAMANAPDGVIAAANVQTASNNEHGVALALRRYVLS